MIVELISRRILTQLWVDFLICLQLQDTVLELEFQGVKKQLTMLQVSTFVTWMHFVSAFVETLVTF